MFDTQKTRPTTEFSTEEILKLKGLLDTNVIEPIDREEEDKFFGKKYQRQPTLTSE